jgi:raffinose/stachyose/melibiose transport system permease protein
MISRRKIRHIFLILVAVFQIFPLLNLLINSLKSNEELKISLFSFPEKLHFSNFSTVWERGSYLISFKNSITIGVATVLLVLIFNGLAAYALTKLNIMCKELFTAYFLIALTIPVFTYIVPTFFMFHKLGLVNNHLGIIMIYTATNIPFNLLLLRAFFLGIPRELEEAGKIDGCSEARTMWHITLPLSKPIMTTVALIVFVHCWNEYFFANTFLQNDELRTVSLRFFNFVGRYSTDWAYVFTAGVISVFPIIILYIALQKTFIEGMISGGVKG